MKTRILLLRDAIQGWSAHKAARLAAALAFYTALALAPILIFVVAIVGLVYSGEEAKATLIEQANNAVGESGAEVVTTVLASATDPSEGILATILSLLLVLLSASNLFNQLQDAFNTIWEVPQEKLKGVVRMIFLRLKAAGMVFLIGLLLIFTVVLGIVVQALKGFAEEVVLFLSDAVPVFSDAVWTTIINNVLPAIDIGVSFLVLALLFGWMFKSIPATTIEWRDVRLGALITAALFVLGKWGLSYYLGRGSVGSAYGAAGSLIVLLMWVYYTGQILFYGVEYTRAYAYAVGSRAGQSLEPEPVVEAVEAELA